MKLAGFCQSKIAAGVFDVEGIKFAVKKADRFYEVNLQSDCFPTTQGEIKKLTRLTYVKLVDDSSINNVFKKVFTE